VAGGGTNKLSNLALACPTCNLYKSNATDGYDPETDATVRLFDPRTDLWSDHFRLNVANGQISGISPAGRATVSRLRLNHAVQTEARILWIRLGVYP